MQFDWWTFGLQTINFLVVVWLLSRLLFRPIRRVIEEREAADRKSAEESRQKTEDALAAKQEYEQKAAELEKKQQASEAAFRKSLEEERAKTLEKARNEAARVLEEARVRAEQEEKQALESLKGQLVALAGDLARKALAGDKPTNSEDMQRVCNYLDRLPAAELNSLIADLREPNAALIVFTPSALPENLKTEWSAALKHRLGKEAKIAFKAEPDILGGVELRFPHAAVNFSVAERLSRAAAAMKD
jgi:F-type H+-transporting ATPase subunit b